MANRMHKDFSRDKMFDKQKDLANKKLTEIEGKIKRKQ